MTMINNQLKLSRSQLAFMEAFVELMGSTPFEKITVQQIVEQSGYSHSSFYLSFTDKYDLAKQLLLYEASVYIEPVVQQMEKGVVPNEESGYELALLCMKRVRQNTTLYRIIVRSMIPDYGKDFFFQAAMQKFEERVHLMTAQRYPQFNVDLYTRCAVNLWSTCITYWDEQDYAQSPEYMAQQINTMRLLMSGETIFELLSVK
jgi:AcrR family transcriptional regulator